MISWGVIDSSIAIATVIDELYTPQAKQLLNQLKAQQVQIAAPLLFQYEVVAVMRKNVYRGSLSLTEAEEGREILLAYPIRFLIDDALLRRSYELATLYNRPTAYDSQYLAVAERLGCEFWTADERLFNAVNPSLPWVRWIGNFPIP